MLPCLACKKHVVNDEEDEEDEGDGSADPSTKAQVKSLSSQLKDVVLKVSVAYRQCRPCTSGGSSLHKAGHEEQELTVASDASSSSDGWSNKAPGSSGSTVGKNHVRYHSSTSTASSSVSEATTATTNKQEGTSPRTSQLGESQDDTGQEWVAQVEPGVLITFIALPNGENELKRIRFSRELFNKWQAEAWWGVNCERVHELYNVSGNDRSFPSSRREVNGNSMLSSRVGRQEETEGKQDVEKQQESSSDNNSDGKQKSEELSEWVEEDEPGVYITVRLGANGNRELKRVRFSRERFSEKQAKLWWERNRFRIHDNYL